MLQLDSHGTQYVVRKVKLGPHKVQTEDEVQDTQPTEHRLAILSVMVYERMG